jgi:hypothetical protein
MILVLLSRHVHPVRKRPHGRDAPEARRLDGALIVYRNTMARSVREATTGITRPMRILLGQITTSALQVVGRG